jgi:hypothetical protein
VCCSCVRVLCVCGAQESFSEIDQENKTSDQVRPTGERNGVVEGVQWVMWCDGPQDTFHATKRS